jgi:SPP1 gp7 family putative phage head morphogenesis protein
MTTVASDSKSSLGEIAKHEADWQVKAIADASAVDLDLVTPAPGVLRAIVTQKPALGELVKSFWKDESKALAQKVVARTSIGIAEGQTTAEIVQGIRGTQARAFTDGILETGRRDAEAIVRTLTNHVSAYAREETYKANGDVIKGIQWVSTLDTRTTPICQSLDGTIFPVGEGRRPPAHWGCRSTTVPVLKSWKELGINLKEAPEGTRASMNGQVPKSMNYEGWLKKMDANPATRHLVDEALGPGRAKLFRGGASVKSFVDRFHQPLTLDEISKKEGLGG